MSTIKCFTTNIFTRKKCFTRKIFYWKCTLLKCTHTQILALRSVFEGLELAPISATFRETTKTNHGRTRPAAQGSSPEHPKTSSQTVNLQPREAHQTEAVTLITPSKVASHSNLEMFSAHCSSNSESSL